MGLLSAEPILLLVTRLLMPLEQKIGTMLRSSTLIQCDIFIVWFSLTKLKDIPSHTEKILALYQ